jgi:hypothetical protein
MTGTKKLSLLGEKTEVGKRQTESTATLAETCHMCRPKTGSFINDGDGLEQAIAELKSALFQPASFCLSAVNEYIVLHETVHPVSSGIPTSSFEATEGQ